MIPIPASCVSLKPKRVQRALLAAHGAVSVAARALKVPAHDLRVLTRAHPELLAAALEAEERALDEAEALIRQELKADDLARRLRAAALILGTWPTARRRGWKPLVSSV